MRKQDAVVLLGLLFEEEINHLNLRIIRDNQAPRFASLLDEHPEIQKEFLAARVIHDDLKRIRDKMVGILKAYIESDEETPDEADKE